MVVGVLLERALILGALVNIAALKELPHDTFYSLLMIGEFVAGMVLVLLSPRLRYPSSR